MKASGKWLLVVAGVVLLGRLGTDLYLALSSSQAGGEVFDERRSWLVLDLLVLTPIPILLGILFAPGAIRKRILVARNPGSIFATIRINPYLRKKLQSRTGGKGPRGFTLGLVGLPGKVQLWTGILRPRMMTEFLSGEISAIDRVLIQDKFRNFEAVRLSHFKFGATVLTPSGRPGGALPASAAEVDLLIDRLREHSLHLTPRNLNS